MSNGFTDQEISKALDDFLNGKKLESELWGALQAYIHITGPKDKRFWQFAKIAENDPKLKEVIIRGVNFHYTGAFHFFRKLPNYQFTKDERKKIIENVNPITACKLLIHKLYLTEEFDFLANRAIHDWHSLSAKKEFFSKVPYTQNHVDTLYKRVTTASHYGKPHQAFIFLSIFPNDSRREELFGYLVTNITLVMKFVKDHDLNKKEKICLINTLKDQSGFQIIKYKDILNKLFDNQEELQTFLQENIVKILDWSLNKGIDDLIKNNIEITQERIDYIVNRVANTKAWKPKAVKEILEAADREQIQISEEDYNKLTSALVFKILTV